MFRTWFRKLKCVYLTKILRQQGDPSYIARGIALGLVIGWIIPMGLQIIIVLPLAFLFKAAKIPACLATLISNHFTVGFLYPMQCFVGAKVLGLDFNLEKIYAEITMLGGAATFQEKWHTTLMLLKEIGGSFVVGGAVFAIPSALIGYFLTLRLVKRYRQLKEAIRRKHEERKMQARNACTQNHKEMER